MEMMDIHAAIERLNQSSDAIVAMCKVLESLPKGESDRLKLESIVAQRALVEAALKTSTITAILIYDQMMFELPLLVGHSEDYPALVKAQARYREESNKAHSVLMKTASINQPAPAVSEAPGPGAPSDRQQRINARFEELMVRNSSLAVGPTAGKVDENAAVMASEAPAVASPISVDTNADPTTKLSD